MQTVKNGVTFGGRFWSQSPQDRPRVLLPGTARGLGTPALLEPAGVREALLTRAGGGGRGRVPHRGTFHLCVPLHIWTCFSTRFSEPD